MVQSLQDNATFPLGNYSFGKTSVLDGNRLDEIPIADRIVKPRNPLVLIPLTSVGETAGVLANPEEAVLVSADRFALYQQLAVSPAAGLEEGVAEARRRMISFINERAIQETIDVLKPTFQPNEPIPLTRLFEKQFNARALRGAGFKLGIAQILGKDIWNPEIRVPAGTFPEPLLIHVQPGTVWSPGMERQFDQAVQDGLVRLVDAQSAQIVVAESDIRADPLRQILLQVDRNSAGTVTLGLLRHVEDLHQRHLMEAGGVILLYRKGDLDEDVYLFA